MKKFISSAIIVIMLFIMTGCREKETICTIESNQSASGYKSKYEYKILSKDDEVLKVDIYQVIDSDNNTILNYYEKMLNEQYQSSNETYGGYEYKVEKKDSSVESNVTLDYSKFNLKKYIEDNPAMKQFLNKNDKITLDGMISLYESSGATCNK